MFFSWAKTEIFLFLGYCQQFPSSWKSSMMPCIQMSHKLLLNPFHGSGSVLGSGSVCPCPLGTSLAHRMTWTLHHCCQVLDDLVPFLRPFPALSKCSRHTGGVFSSCLTQGLFMCCTFSLQWLSLLFTCLVSSGPSITPSQGDAPPWSV